jgi:aryl-alcohol dehydrogenase-like predicted oxidoreductase
MDRITLPGADIETSRIGFGCASLGSRVSAAQGRRALAAAFDAGVTWFDVAPAYGAGEAETILGQALGAHGDQIQICTKVGLAPPMQTLPKKIIRTVLRPAVAAARPLRAALRRSGATANTRVPLTPELIYRSLDRSLSRLGMEQVALYALHNITEDDLMCDEIRYALEAVLASGKARAVAVAGDLEVAWAAIGARPDGGPMAVAQFAQPSTEDEEVFDAAAAMSVGTITHSIFGVSGALQAASPNSFSHL